MSKVIEYGGTGIQSLVRMFDVVNNIPALGLKAADVLGLAGYYRRDFENGVEITLSDQPMAGSWVEGAWRELMTGYYTIDVPDAAFTSGCRGVFVGAGDSAVNYVCIGSYHPLQKVIEAVSFSTEGGLYAVVDDLYDIFGKANVWKWANIESLPSDTAGLEGIIVARITKAITYATADINDKLRGGPYEIPFTDTSLVASINYACAIKAGVWLYEWRGADDYNYENGRVTHRYTFMMDRANKMCEEIRRAARILDQEESEIVGSRAPGVV